MRMKLKKGFGIARSNMPRYTSGMKVRDLEAMVGGLSTPSKMPGYAYGIPAQACKLGSLLATKKGSVCNSCYALKGMYVFPVVKAAQARRLEAISRPEWASWMAELIGKKYRNRSGADRVFRWHDSGDLQSVDHLSKIVEIAKSLPDIRFWLPTRERGIVQNWIVRHGAWPDNLTVRVSAAMVGQETGPTPKGTVGSTVGADTGHLCPAKGQGNACLDCRACWNKNVESVDYSLH